MKPVDPERTTSTDYRRPYRPKTVAALNALGQGLRSLRGSPGGRLPSAERLAAIAEKKTGLLNFGGLKFEEPLTRLIDAINDEAALTFFGEMVIKRKLVSALCHGLRVQRLLESHPQIGSFDVSGPVVITGLQRTGTTLLHRLLAADPDFRSLASWEALNPAPLKKRPWHRADPRLSAARLAERSLSYLAPDFFAIHPVEAEAPEEEVLLLDLSFMSTVPEAILNVPSYAAWLEKQDQRPAYRYLETLLKVLEWQRSARGWVLKTPHHLEWLDVLLEVFPRAKVIQTHRDPAKTVASLCSMTAHGRGVFSDRVEPLDIGRQWSAKLRRMVNRSMEVREVKGDHSFIDVSYYDLVENPMEEVRRIYDFIGRELSREAEQRMQRTLSVNTRHKYGRHRYDLNDFGLREDDLRTGFASYTERHNVRAE